MAEFEAEFDDVADPADGAGGRRPPLAVTDVLAMLAEGPLHGLRLAAAARPAHAGGEGPHDDRLRGRRASTCWSPPPSSRSAWTCRTRRSWWSWTPTGSGSPSCTSCAAGSAAAATRACACSSPTPPTVRPPASGSTRSPRPPTASCWPASTSSSAARATCSGVAQSGRRSQLKLLSLLKDEDLIVAARAEASRPRRRRSRPRRPPRARRPGGRPGRRRPGGVPGQGVTRIVARAGEGTAAAGPRPRHPADVRTRPRGAVQHAARPPRPRRRRRARPVRRHAARSASRRSRAAPRRRVRRVRPRAPPRCSSATSTRSGCPAGACCSARSPACWPSRLRRGRRSTWCSPTRPTPLDDDQLAALLQALVDGGLARRRGDGRGRTARPRGPNRGGRRASRWSQNAATARVCFGTVAPNHERRQS